MTYKELRDILYKLPFDSKQLDQNVVITINYNEYLPVLGVENTKETDVLDENHLVLVAFI